MEKFFGSGITGREMDLQSFLEILGNKKPKDVKVSCCSGLSSIEGLPGNLHSWEIKNDSAIFRTELSGTEIIESTIPTAPKESLRIVRQAGGGIAVFNKYVLGPMLIFKM